MLGILTDGGSARKYNITDARSVKWSTHYSVDGCGFGYLKFSLYREVGHDYSDFGFGYEITVRISGANVVFHGQIRLIEEVFENGTGRIDVTCLGDVIVAQDAEMFRHYCDKRLNRWKPDTENPKGNFRPDRYTIGTNELGFYVHASNNKDLDLNNYTEVIYRFDGDEEYAQRFKATLSMVLGSGTVFDGTVASVDSENGYIDYANDSGESRLAADMVVYNSTKGKQATIQSVDTGTNRITVVAPAHVDGWEADDELAVYGPLYVGQIDSIADDVITYGTDLLRGESNLSIGQTLCNVSKKGTATIDSIDTGADTITVTDEDHITGWDDSDVLSVMAPYFQATFVSDSDVTITYSSPIGERVASQTTGWTLHNVDEDEYATVDSWDIASNQLDVTDAGDITANWTNGDTLRIYTPFRFQILDTEGNVLWPESDAREGRVSQDRTSINVTTSGDPEGFVIRYSNYIAGDADETSFAQLTNVRAYSTTSSVTASMLAEEVVSLLSGSGFDLGSDTDDIENVTNELEPMVFEFVTPKAAMVWACSFGNSSGDELVWGVRLDDAMTFFLESVDDSTVKYVVMREKMSKATVSGDIQQSFQNIRGVYTDKLGDQKVTAWQADDGAYFSDRKREKSVRLDNIDTNSEAVSAITIYLDEVKVPKRGVSYSIAQGAVKDKNNRTVDVLSMKADGGLVQIRDWRAAESSGSGTGVADSWTTEQISVVEVDYDARSVTLTPAAARSSFEKYMSALARIAEA